MIAPNRETMTELLTPQPQPIVRPELPPLPSQEVLDQLKEHSERLETATPWQILEWAVKAYYPSLTMATAFGPEGCVILYMLSKIEPRVHVFNLDTGYQFQ
jgi:phosphoadenosine phosphosulfate reductase